jgi:hypothetical protein
MAHFAKINEDNIVEEVLVVPDSEEHRGQDFLAIDLGLGGRWIQTSINDRIRKVFARVGATYLPDEDAFVPLKPEGFESFIFDAESWSWIPPLPLPTDADWVVGFGPQPAPKEVEVDEVDEETGEPTGNKIIIVVPDLAENPKIYMWNELTQSWDNPPKPSKVE